MNTGSTMGTAILRGFYNFVATTMVGGITCYLSMSAIVGDAPTVSGQDVVIVSGLTGILAGLGALGFRGGIEGLADRSRQLAGEVKANDVQAGSAGKA